MIFGSRAEAIAHTYEKAFDYFVDFEGEPIHGWNCYDENGAQIPKSEIKDFVTLYDAWEELVLEEGWEI